jgi:hypothetical protein
MEALGMRVTDVYRYRLPTTVFRPVVEADLQVGLEES